MPQKIYFFVYCFYLIAIVSIYSCRSASISPCSACRAAAESLGERLENESREIENELDMRNRLDGEGKRYGKIIDYAHSELRATKLLDDLCNAQWAENYILDSNANVWVRRIDGLDAEHNSTEQQKHERKEQQKRLRSQCSDIIGAWEDELMEALMKGDVLKTSKDVEDLLCVQLGSLCSANSDTVSKSSVQDEL